MMHILKAFGFIIVYMLALNVISIPLYFIELYTRKGNGFLKNIDPVEIWIMEAILFASSIVVLLLGGDKLL